MKRVVVGSDHAGFKLKEVVKNLLGEWGYHVDDVGTHDENPVDYPDCAEKVALKALEKRGGKGILVCGTGIGASIAANKIPGIRAALVANVEDARLSREHNDANLLVLGGWEYNKKQIHRILETWLHGKFQGGRHRRRVNKIAQIEKKYRKISMRRKGRPWLGVAGPVLHGRCETTKLPWVVEAGQIGWQFAIPSVALLNDLGATAYDTMTLTEKDYFILNQGEKEIIYPETGTRGNRAIIPAGTGLGEAILLSRRPRTLS